MYGALESSVPTAVRIYEMVTIGRALWDMLSYVIADAGSKPTEQNA